MYRRRYSLEEWQAIVSHYHDALVYAAKIWVPGDWTIIAAVGLTALAPLAHALSPRPMRLWHLLIAPFAGAFAGGYFQALALHGAACRDVGKLLCLMRSPDLHLILLGTALSVVLVYLALPGRKWSRQFLPTGVLDGGGGSDDAYARMLDRIDGNNRR